MKPTAMDTATSTPNLDLVRDPSLGQLSLITPTSSGQIVLKPEQVAIAEQQLRALNFEVMSPAEITMLGHDAERSLTQTLDGFLTNIDRAKNPKLFALFDRLQDGVVDAKLPELLVQIQNGDKSLKARIAGIFSKKALAKAAQDAYQATCDLVAGRTKSLTSVMNSLETELATALQELLGELHNMETLKENYRDRIDDFAIATAVTHAFVQQARQFVEGKRQLQLANPDALSQSDLQEYEVKLELLESRALALEGVYSRLPADQLVIQQIQSAGVQTLQETATTATARFSSIKTTLIALHGALQVKGVQQLAAKNADLDRQLAQVRGSLMKEVVTTAANAPGDNRLEQARQLQALITLTGEVHDLVERARQENTKKFAAASTMFASARSDLANLNQKQIPTSAS